MLAPRTPPTIRGRVQTDKDYGVTQDGWRKNVCYDHGEKLRRTQQRGEAHYEAERDIPPPPQQSKGHTSAPQRQRPRGAVAEGDQLLPDSNRIPSLLEIAAQLAALVRD